MRVVALYHPQGEFGGVVEEYKSDFEARFQDKKIELISLETMAGSVMAELYDVVRYPAILAIADDGSLLKFWQDQPWPLQDEVAAYANA